MERYHLSNESIVLACQSAERFLLSIKADRKEAMRLLLVMEEALLNSQERFGEEHEFTLQPRKFITYKEIVLRIRGESFNPRNPDNDSDAELLRRLTSNSTSTYTWQYKGGCNTIHLAPQKKPKISLTAMTIIAIVLAIIVGMLCLNLPEDIRVPLLNDFVSPILDTVLGVIAAVAGPTVFFSLVWGVGAIGDMETLSKIGKRMLLSFLVGLLILSFLATLVCSPFFTIEMEGGTAFQFSQILNLLLGVIPTNLFSPFTEGNIQQMIVLAVVFGIVLLVLGDELSAVSTLINQLNTMIQYVMGLVIALIPPMVFLSIFKIVVNGQASLILKAYKLIPLCLGIALLFIALYTLIIAVKHKVSVVTLVKKAWPVFIIGLTTSSSSAALTTNLKTTRELFGVDNRIANFGVPIGQTLFRPGEVMRYVVLGFIMAEMYDVPMTIGWIIILLFTSFLLSIATPPVAGGAAVCLSVLFMQMGIPEDALGFAVAINVILGFLLTAVSLYCLQMELTRLAGTLDMLDVDVLRREDTIDTKAGGRSGGGEGGKQEDVEATTA